MPTTFRIDTKLYREAKAVRAGTPVRIRTYRAGEAFPFDDRQLKRIAAREQESHNAHLLKAFPAVLCFLFVLLAGCAGGPGQRKAIALAQRGATENMAFPWNVHKGMLGVRFGMTQKEVTSILGSPSEKLGLTAWQYHRLGFAVLFDEHGRVRSFLAGSNGCDPSQCLTRAFKGVTEKGIKMGSTEAEIVRAYGAPLTKETFSPDLVTLRYGKSGERWGFSLRNGKVSHLYAVVISKAL